MNQRNAHPDGPARGAGNPDSAGALATQDMPLPGTEPTAATYTLKQPEKDRSPDEQLIAAAQEMSRFGDHRLSARLALN
ncbi:integrase catalytic subunit [Burkholderia pseudomallei]|nr:putative transposase [Burkholderia pseudomallei MSHR4503]VBY43519.1 integrase catalytic subunit [Burkholderia pseudomallei]VBY74948.1 integrase catalytic subunit [Burkholderia pseudomallei]